MQGASKYQPIRFRAMVRLAFLICVLCLALSAVAQDSAQSIIQRSVEAINADWREAPKDGHFERHQDDHGTKTYHVMMILGSPYRCLVEVDGKPLAPDEQPKEQLKLQHVIAQRRVESQQERSQRLAKYEKERKEIHLFVQQLTNAFDFKLLGEEQLGQYRVYVLQASASPSYQPPNVETKVLAGMQCRFWIDKQTFQWVKVEAEVVRPVSIAGLLVISLP